MNSLPYFLLNVMIWDLLASVFATIEHGLPILPFDCFHVDGVIIIFTKNEIVYHIASACYLVTRMNSSLAQFFIFPYRYLTIAFGKKTSRVNPKWGIAFCASIHAVHVISFIYVYVNIIGLYDHYPFGKNPPAKKEIACYDHYGSLKNSYSIFFTFLTFTLAALTVVFSLLLVRHFRKMIHLYNKQTLEMHRKFLRSLIIITTVPVLLGLFPHAIGALNTIFFPGFATETLMITTVMIYLDGTLFYVLCIVAFGPYRQVVRRLVSRLFKMKNVVNVSSISVVP
ncbi:hypothetical protein QR680_015465 [Steinernema hermaphroditum]|uniref:Uncharacterized protein n=1 Tax=Steinernema hermaphroditum TaxID=289476 RepID=A0AA39H8T9_9BILA|nr:hypothetical protein QR680_015465 [Steinernema hermaphroditum]